MPSLILNVLVVQCQALPGMHAAWTVTLIHRTMQLERQAMHQRCSQLLKKVILHGDLSQQVCLACKCTVEE